MGTAGEPLQGKSAGEGRHPNGQDHKVQEANAARHCHWLCMYVSSLYMFYKSPLIYLLC